MGHQLPTESPIELKDNSIRCVELACYSVKLSVPLLELDDIVVEENPKKYTLQRRL